MGLEELAGVKQVLKIARFGREPFRLPIAKHFKSGHKISVSVTELALFVGLSAQSSLDIRPIRIVNLKVLSDAPGAVSEDPIHLKPDRTIWALKFGIDHSFHVAWLDGFLLRAWTGFARDVL